MSRPASFQLKAAPLPADRAPRVLQSVERSAGAADEDPFLPRGLLSVDQAFDLAPAARSVPGAEAERALTPHGGQVMLLELPDGVTVITHPENLRRTIERIDPASVDAGGTVNFDRALATRSAALRGLGGAIGDGLGSLVSKVFTLTVDPTADPIIEAAERKAAEWLGAKAGAVADAELGVSWLGTKALMWAIESRLKSDPGLYRWTGGRFGERIASGDALKAGAGPLLVFIHGTGSSTEGSFDTLQSASAAYWKAFEDRYGDRVFAFEHRTLSESPADNALQLARALPEGATVHLVSHSRGGLVGDLMCLVDFEALIDGFALDNALPAAEDEAERARITAELETAYAEQRATLRELAAELKAKKLIVERYVRVASPARGTRLASGNFDVFLSALLSLMGWVPAFKGNPVYSAFKRVVLEVARNRTRPELVPGIEAMLPGSPMARFLARATPQPALQLAIISGDIEGGGWLKRLGVLFTDFTFFDDTSNDLVVDTDSMTAGIARGGQAKVMFDRGPEINHFRYFVNEETRSALAAWLTERSVDAIEAFKPLPTVDDVPRDRGGDAARGADAPPKPVVIVLPGIMGSHLWLHRRDRVWFSLVSLALGGLAKIALPADGSADSVEAEALFDRFYGALQQRLAATHEVVPWPYDWRLPLDLLADRLAATLRAQLDATATPPRPVRLLAHSMGGLVVRALIHRQPALWDELMSRPDTRLVMLGTPHQGSHLMVETLVGKADTVRKLGVLDQQHDLQSVIDIIAGFPGALALLPKPGFADTGNDKPFDYFDAAAWPAYKKDMRDLWFGNGIGGLPSAPVLARAAWLWQQDGLARPALPERHKGKVAYVFGCAPKTPCGIVHDGGGWKMLGTSQGDGSVTWASGAIDGIGARFYMPVEHGALADTEAYFDSIAELLEHGTGGSLTTTPPALRDVGTPVVATYDAGPPTYPTELELAAGLFGTAPRPRSRARQAERLSIRVKAMDLRQVTQPIVVGHYEQDAISGAEALIDRFVVHGELSVRHHLGLYAGEIGTASAVLVNGNAAERARGSLRGAVVTGLGKYDGSLTVGRLTEAARTACLRYLVHMLDSGSLAGGAELAQGVRLSTLLLGYNSSANLTIADSVQALLRGAVDANLHFAKTTRSKLRITGLDIVEIYLDTAISAAYAARQIAATMNADARIACRIEVEPVLHQGEGMRQRLFDSRGDTYWPRLLITDAATAEDPGARDSFDGKKTEPAGIAYAERLRFLYLGQRARAEAVVMQRQPGLVERMVERQVMRLAYDADFSRTLFQLLVPHDFKDAARQMQQMVFVVDSTTANLPWELMLADDEPLATRTAMVRQLTTTQFRARVAQTMERRAYVVGNPSTANFFKHFPDPRVPDLSGLDDLPAAEREATVVAESLTREGFEVERAIGSDQQAIDVVSRLYRHPYRIVHIAGHGLFQMAADDGLTRSGVVLSDGILITAAEIDAMEIVPELVFLNCCHLGKIDRSPVAFNRLAYSIARQLIDIGVRAVVVAGWAVEDAPASLFAETFYERLLNDRMNFGAAVFAARRAAWERYPASITWGAYQAYGDPAWRVDQKVDRPLAADTAGWSGVAPEELLDRIESERLELQRCGEAISAVDAGRLHARCQQWIKSMPPAWAARADVYGALGDLYGDLGPDYGEHARDCYLRALQGSDDDVEVSVRCVEQLAVLEARAGLQHDDPALVLRAIDRLTRLMQATEGPLSAAAGVNPKRAGLLGSSWKRKAAVHARRYLAGHAPAELRSMGEAVLHAAEAYRAVSTDAATRTERPYQTLNWLFLHTLVARPRELPPFIPVAERCATLANAAYLDEPDAWNSTLVADAALLVALLDGSLQAAGAAGDAVLSRLEAGYRAALDSALVSPKERSSVIQQLELLALLHEARGVATKNPVRQTGGQRLKALAQRLASREEAEPAAVVEAAGQTA